MEYSSCGVGLVTSIKQEANHEHLQKALLGLKNVEHRGGVGKDKLFGDGAGILTDIPFEFFGFEQNSVGVATIFGPKDEERFKLSLEIFERTFSHYGLKVIKYRDVPIRAEALSPLATENMPRIFQAFIERPEYCRTLASFDKKLYLAKQILRTKQKEQGISGDFFFSSLSSRTITYKALATSAQLEEFYPDLKDPNFKIIFAIFHRRFSTNTRSSWDKVQPFRLIAHNGEINTVEGNRSAAISREKSIGLEADELVTHFGASDSGNLNEMVEALKYRSSIPNITEILSILVPPASHEESEYFKFWSRAMEPWDGPALIAYSDGKRIGARLDRNGFRPCRWARTQENFYLASEAGCFELDPKNILEQGSLYAGRSVSIHIHTGEINFSNPDRMPFYEGAHFDPRLIKLDYCSPSQNQEQFLGQKGLFFYTKEDLNKELYPMIENGAEAIGSMGDTARLPAMSDIHRSLYDYFYQNFAQVTNPPLDYIREKIVTELKVYLGRKPNIFEPKEMIPPPHALELKSPVISLGQMEKIYNLNEDNPLINVNVLSFDILFKRGSSVDEFKKTIQDIVQNVVLAVKSGAHVIILSDRKATFEMLPIPSILLMRAVQLELNRLGIRLRISLIVDSGEIRNAHQIAVLISFGASAICPYLALDIARHEDLKKIEELFPDEREKNLIQALEKGLLRIMAKRGISVVRSYQGAELFTIIGLGDDIIKTFFKKHKSLIGGLNFKSLLDEIHTRTELTKDGTLINNFVYKEHFSGKLGEKHSATSKRSRQMHKILEKKVTDPEAIKGFNEFAAEFDAPLHIRHLFSYKKNAIDIEQVEDASHILKTFGCGAMSFGAISAQAQRDLVVAFNEVGGRSNSGEGGENPFYYSEGISASVKQIASGRFGVTAEYLLTGNEVQIKIAQGAKPGEGGQLMGVKVNKDIAFARHANVGVDLISPPPQHDIYSIEDLKQLIFELKQLNENLKISVKLVAGMNIGNIAVGVVKAGADIIQISGGDGGTGAAGLSSMKHAGIPWEIGLNEVHKVLSENDLREHVILRVDGGLQSGRDIIMGSILGAEEFDFGKIVLIAEGCIMARVCEKNTCPAGIATHDPKFQARYTGSSEKVIRYLRHLAQDVRNHLAAIGISKLSDLLGRADLLVKNEKYKEFFIQHNLNVDSFFEGGNTQGFSTVLNKISTNDLNLKILNEFKQSKTDSFKASYQIKSTDRAVPGVLTGHLAMLVNKKRLESDDKAIYPDIKKSVELNFIGSAGQGFALFTTAEMTINLSGEANDSVGKGMSGGKIVINPAQTSKINCDDSVLIGNTALYGATGGEFFLNGLCGDRFAVRNSGATAVIKGAGLHACEYMTGGKVIILGPALENIGAGMTGGELYIHKMNIDHINHDYLRQIPLKKSDIEFLKRTLRDFDNSCRSQFVLTYNEIIEELVKFIPHS